MIVYTQVERPGISQNLPSINRQSTLQILDDYILLIRMAPAPLKFQPQSSLSLSLFPLFQCVLMIYHIWICLRCIGENVENVWIGKIDFNLLLNF